MNPETIYVTGAGGFLGQALCRVLGERFPETRVEPLCSPRQGGVNLADPGAAEWLRERHPITDPARTAIVHAAAHVEWQSPAGAARNVAMAWSVVRWAASPTGAVRVVFVSGVNVYPIHEGWVGCGAPVAPASPYGVGKAAAEMLFRACLPAERLAILRLPGIWGWQARPTLFWNRLLHAANEHGPEAVVRRLGSFRNYVSSGEAAGCVARTLQADLQGTFLVGGLEAVSNGQYLEELAKLPGARPSARIEDDGGTDSLLYQPCAEMQPELRPWRSELRALWAERAKL